MIFLSEKCRISIDLKQRKETVFIQAGISYEINKGDKIMIEDVYNHDSVKVYIKDVLYFKEIPMKWGNVLNELILQDASASESGVEICISAGTKKDLAESLKCDADDIADAIKGLTSKGILQQEYDDNCKKLTGLYLLNPELFGDTKWSHSAELSFTTDFNDQESRLGKIVVLHESPSGEIWSADEQDADSASEVLKKQLTVLQTQFNDVVKQITRATQVIDNIDRQDK